MKEIRLFLSAAITSSVLLLIAQGCTGAGKCLPVKYEGKIYKTVKIGDQCWLKENLNVGQRIDIAAEMSDNGEVEKYCYNDSPDSCNIYGGLYQWDEVMQYVTAESTRGICPPGWHLPTHEEWQLLLTTTGESGNALKAVGQGMGAGAGTNTSGFSVLLAGYRKDIGSSGGLGGGTYLWSSTVYNSGSAYVLGIISSDDNLGFDHTPKDFGFSVRCLKN